MHPAWDIFEVLWMILDVLQGDFDRQSLLNFALTCHGFQEAALDRMWDSLVLYLGRLMQPLTMTGLVDLDSGNEASVRVLTSEELEKLLGYTRRIKILRLDSMDSMDQQALQALVTISAPNRLLPRLQSFTIYNTFREKELSQSSLLLDKSLHHLGISTNLSYSSVLTRTCLLDLVSKSPHMRSLTLSRSVIQGPPMNPPPQISPNPSPPVKEMLSRLTELRMVHLPFPISITLDLLVLLGRLPLLSSLILKSSSNSSSNPWPPPSFSEALFPSLDRVTIRDSSGKYELEDFSYFFQLPGQRLLQHIDIMSGCSGPSSVKSVLEAFRDSTPIYARPTLGLLELEPHFQASLTQPASSEASNQPLRFHHLSPLMHSCFRSLYTLRIAYRLHCAFNDEELLLLAGALPCLERLQLSPDVRDVSWWRPVPRITLRGLVGLGIKCRHLRFLNLAVDLYPILDLEVPPAPDRRSMVELWSIGYSCIRGAREVALSLAQYFPHLHMLREGRFDLRRDKPRYRLEADDAWAQRTKEFMTVARFLWDTREMHMSDEPGPELADQLGQRWDLNASCRLEPVEA